MRMSYSFLLALGLALAFPVSYGSDESWNDNLSCPGGGVWNNRVEVTVRNTSARPLEDASVSIPIRGVSSDAGQSLPLVGVKSESIRVADAKGKEYRFEICDTANEPYHRGKLKEGFTLSIPVTCQPNEEARYIVQYNNDQGWLLPDWLTIQGRLRNNGFERGEKNIPTGWVFDAASENRRIEWSSESPVEGNKCVKVVVPPGSSPSWIAARQLGIRLKPGAAYRFSAYVKADHVTGTCGWYAHIGNEKNSMMVNKMADAGRGTYEWRKVSFEFTTPNDADTLSFGTVLYGTGTAWYDDVRFEPVDPETSTDWDVSVGKVESTPYPHFRFKGQTATAFVPDSSLVPADYRFALLRLLNRADSTGSTTTVFLDSSSLQNRWGRSLTEKDIVIYEADGNRATVKKWDTYFFFDAKLRKKGYYYFLVVEQPGKKESVTKGAQVATPGGAFPGTLQQIMDDGAFPGTSRQLRANRSGIVNVVPLPPELKKLNLVLNGDLEDSRPGIPHWSSGSLDKGVTIRLVDPKVPFLGKQSLELSVDPKAPNAWRGSRQSVKVTGGRKYLLGLWMSCETTTGIYQVHVHQRKADGSLSSGGMSSVSASISGKADWTLINEIITTTNDTDTIQLHLTSNHSGTVRYDNIFLVEVETVTSQEFGGGKNGVFQIPAIVKVFHDSTFPSTSRTLAAFGPHDGAGGLAEIAAARNEEEALQLAVRLPQSQRLNVAATAPVCSESNATLPSPMIYVVGNVPVDYPSNYYKTEEKKTIRFKPQASISCDGWSGLWPDPLIPVQRPDAAKEEAKGQSVADLFPGVDWSSDSAKLAACGKESFVPFEAGKTRALWFIVKIPKTAKAGFYSGTILLENPETKFACRVPYRVQVFDFTLPDRPACGAIYDDRPGKYTRGNLAEARKKTTEFLASKLLCPDTLPASVSIKYDKTTGTASADWTTFDKIASWYFDVLGIRYSYMPSRLFYLFGWGMPPKVIEGENPYPGEYPFEKVDRSKLRPEFKKAYQAKLRRFWDHVKAKGWDKNFVLYISDEPFYYQPEIIKQMQALCSMIHDVDPGIPIYSSTWHHVPEWDGALNVWGIGHYGIVPIEQIARTKSRGDRIWWTTDGQMCLDTPYCAIERLLPYWCHYYGADVYEFWGANWYTYDPFQFGWHSYIPQSDTPGNHYHVRYPNGDGYIFYPGHLIGLDGFISSVRMEQSRAGVEDAAYLAILKSELERCADKDSSAYKRGQNIWDQVRKLVPIPGATGRYSGKLLPRPEIVDQLKHEVANAIVELQKNQ